MRIRAQGYFPQLDARSLDGTTYRLPRDFAGALNLAVIAFTIQQQALVDRWLAAVAPLVAGAPDLRAYEVPVIDARYLPARSVIDGGMAAAIPSAVVRARTLTVYTHLAHVQAALEIMSTATVTVVLVTRSGAILWRGSGEPQQADIAALSVIIADMVQGSATIVDMEQIG